MSRTKYRVWDLVEKTMMYEGDIDNFVIDTGEDGYFHVLKVARFVPQQYTGLKDKSKKKEIVEGDYVKTVDGIAKVIYEPSIAAFALDYPNHRISIVHYLADVGNDLEVVGNYYETDITTLSA